MTTRILKAENAYQNISRSKKSFKAPWAKLNLAKTSFLNFSIFLKKYIKIGDIFQVVLSQRFEANMIKKPLDIYKKLRVTNPSPFMFFFNFNDFFN